MNDQGLAACTAAGCAAAGEGLTAPAPTRQPMACGGRARSSAGRAACAMGACLPALGSGHWQRREPSRRVSAVAASSTPSSTVACAGVARSGRRHRLREGRGRSSTAAELRALWDEPSMASGRCGRALRGRHADWDGYTWAPCGVPAAADSTRLSPVGTDERASPDRDARGACPSWLPSAVGPRAPIRAAPRQPAASRRGRRWARRSAATACRRRPRSTGAAAVADERCAWRVSIGRADPAAGPPRRAAAVQLERRAPGPRQVVQVDADRGAPLGVERVHERVLRAVVERVRPAAVRLEARDRHAAHVLVGLARIHDRLREEVCARMS